MRFSFLPCQRGGSSGQARQGRAWIWFFTVLIVLTLTAITIQIWYNSRQQLTWEQLQAAEQLWKQKGPADYDLDYTIKKVGSTDVYHIQVRKGQVVSATCNDQPLPERSYHYQDMPHLLGYIEEFWRQDHPESQPGQRVYATASFDAEDGHLIHYVRSVTSKRERVEITVELHRVAASATRAPVRPPHKFGLLSASDRSPIPSQGAVRPSIQRLAASFCERGRGPAVDSVRARRSSRPNEIAIAGQQVNPAIP